MNVHREIAFEDEICGHLAANGWLHEAGDAARYDRARALFVPDLLEWVRLSQPKAWEQLSKANGAAMAAALADRVRKQIDARGTLDVLRHGIDLMGVRGRIKLAEFKPALAENEAILERYRANRLRVVRQLRYSTANENALDLVLFLNGIAVATAELKTDFTQSVEDAVDQYRFDREPRPKGGSAEPLLDFLRGAIVHFAVSNAEVRMTTRLAGKETVFLPFNRGNDGGAGNPPDPDGHRTAYLWEQVWEWDSWLELLGRYVIAEKNRKGQINKIIFPRFHQLDATRKLVAAVRAEGAGKKYLIQHSAGSGKTNSIAWTAHLLADLHDEERRKVFDSVIVVSDRKVIDGQLQTAIFGFERTTGVVATVKGEGASKSAELATALAEGKKIVVCTIQTFPFALEEVRRLSATEGKTFGVIADEAHSSQTGQAATKLKQTLSAEEVEALDDGGEIGTEDVLAAQMRARASDAGITYIAFTATPKAKTLELFGRRPRPDEPAGETNLPRPFHVYSMRQAIEEGFILDVLQNYTPYSLAFRLATEGKELDETEVERDAAMRGLMRWVRLHPYNIAQKVQIVVEHFRANVAHHLGGRAKAMVVLASRKEAVRWKLAIDRYITEKKYQIGTLVAFSGEVNDPESGPEPFTEAGRRMNPDLKGRKVDEVFDTDDFHILLVANKYQTGFDQPLLCAMYVDRRLAGVQAVQTLSRLNRAWARDGYVKDTTYVLDFSDSTEEVLDAFSQYYGEACLRDVTDPNLIFDLKAKLDATGHYDENEVERVVRLELNPNARQSELVAALEPVADRLIRAFARAKLEKREALAASDHEAGKAADESMAALNQFKGDIQAYLRMYSFLSQIFDYGNTSVEKRAMFFRRLLPLLEFGREREGVDLSSVKLTHHKVISKGGRRLQPAATGEGLSPPAEAGSGEIREKERLRLQEMIRLVNEIFEGELTERDRLIYVNEVLKTKLLESRVLQQQASQNSKEQFANSPDLSNELTEAIMAAAGAHSEMSRQALEDENLRTKLKTVLLGPGELWEALREVVSDND